MQHSFPTISADMTYHLRRFVTAPLPIFEMEYITASSGPPPLLAAAKCLALCIKVSAVLYYIFLLIFICSILLVMTWFCPTYIPSSTTSRQLVKTWEMEL